VITRENTAKAPSRELDNRPTRPLFFPVEEKPHRFFPFERPSGEQGRVLTRIITQCRSSSRRFASFSIMSFVSAEKIPREAWLGGRATARAARCPLNLRLDERVFSRKLGRSVISLPRARRVRSCTPIHLQGLESADSTRVVTCAAFGACDGQTSGFGNRDEITKMRNSIFPLPCLKSIPHILTSMRRV